MTIETGSPVRIDLGCYGVLGSRRDTLQPLVADERVRRRCFSHALHFQLPFLPDGRRTDESFDLRSAFSAPEPRQYVH